MIEMIPVRTAHCLPRVALRDGSHRHEPGHGTVETESNLELEWQFGACLYCEQPISRFRVLSGGNWFDPWGSVDDSAYLISGSTA